MGDAASHLAARPEDDKVAMNRASGGGDQDPLVAGLVKVLADDLAGRPLAGGRERGRQAGASKPFVTVEQGNAIKLNAPWPQVAG